MGRKKKNGYTQKEKQEMFNGSYGFYGAANHLAVPCSDKEEAYLVSNLMKLPIYIEDATGSSESFLFDAYTAKLNAEMLNHSFIGEDSNRSALNGYIFPAGMSLNLALDAIRQNIDSDKKLWELEEADLTSLENALAKLPQHNADNDDDIKKAALVLIALGGLLRYLLENDAGVSWEKVIIYLDEVSYRPSYDSSSHRVGKAASTLNKDTYHHGAHIRCLTDIIYYSLLYFSIRNKRSYLRRCKMCERLFFQDNGNDKYCHFRNPGELQRKPDVSCQVAIDYIHADDGKNKGKAGEVKKAIERKLSLKNKLTLEEKWAFQNEYDDYVKETEGDWWKYKNRLEWLERYLNQMGKEDVK